MADPVQASKVLGALDNGETQQQTRQSVQSLACAPWMARLALFTAVMGGSPWSIYSHPDRWPQLLAALGTAAVGGHIMARMSPQATEAYSKMLLKPSPETMRTFSRVARCYADGIMRQPQTPP